MKTLLFTLLLITHQATFGQVCVQNTNSIQFDGTDDYVELSDIDFSGSFSGECWVNTNQLSDAQIISKHSNGLDANYLIAVSNGKLSFQTNVGGIFYNLLGDSIQTGVWYHAAFVYDSTTNKVYLYVNGSKVDSVTTAGGSPVLNNWNTTIGNSAGGTPFYFDGLIDEVRLWSRIISSSEINSKMSDHLDPSVEQDLEGYWRFNEGSGLFSNDTSGNSDTATLIGATWSTIVPFPGPSPAGIVNINGPDEICEGDTATLIASGGISYVWSTGDTTDSIKVSPGNDSSYWVAGTDTNGCVDSVWHSVGFENLPPYGGSGPFSAVCAGDVIQFVASGPWTCEWSPTTYLNNPFICDPLITPLTSITYILTVTGLNGCQVFDTIPLIVHQPLTADAGMDTTICQGDTIMLNGSGGPMCWWIPGTGLSDSMICTPMASPSDTIEYVLAVNDDLSACPMAFDTVTINVQPSSASITISTNDNPLCVGDTAGFVATTINEGSAPSYQWMVNGGNVGANATTYTDHTLTDGDTVVCELTSNAACLTNPLSLSNAIVMEVNSLPTISFSGLGSSYCNDDPVVTLTGSPSGGSFSGPGITGNLFDPSLADTGFHEVVYSYTDSNGCTNSTTELVLVQLCTGITPDHADYSVDIYPNPNHGQFTISWAIPNQDALQVVLYNSLGEQLLSRQIEITSNPQQIKLDLGSSVSGMYVLRLKAAEMIVHRKIVIAAGG